MTDQVDDTAANPEDQAQQDDKSVDNSSKAIIADEAAGEDVAVAAEPEKTAGADKADAAKAEPEKETEGGETDWRVKLAGGDEKELKRLGRFASEADVYKAYRELEKKKDSGEFKRPFPTEGTDEEVAQWRKENGIPDAPEKYDLKFEDGTVIGEEDKPLVDEFVKNMHGENASPAQVKAALSSYYGILGRQQQALAESDASFKDEALEGLREEWEGDFKKNLGAVNGLLQSLPEDTRLAFETARTADGKLIGNDPDVIKWLAQTAYEINPAATVMPSSMSNPGGAISDEISSIEKMVADKESAYWTGSGAEKMQARYLELLSARDKISARS